MGEKIRQSPAEQHFTKNLTSTSQNCQGHQKRGKSEKLSQPSGAYGDKKTKCNVVFWMGFWNDKQTLDKNLKIWEKNISHYVPHLSFPPVRKFLFMCQRKWPTADTENLVFSLRTKVEKNKISSSDAYISIQGKILIGPVWIFCPSLWGSDGWGTHHWTGSSSGTIKNGRAVS